MASLDFEGRSIPVHAGDTVAASLYRAGVRTFSRSFKYHRPRGLYCCTGDCPNCLVTVNGEPAIRACVHPASNGQRVARGSGWPSADHDALAAMWWLRALLPVGFYYKLFARPLWVWPIAERFIRRIAGIGPVPRNVPPAARERLNHHAEVLVIGGGVAGLSAAAAAADEGASVVLADEGRIGETIAPGEVRTEVAERYADLRARERVTILERASAIGIYEGPLVPIAAPDFLHLVHPQRVIVATGAVEMHGVFPGNDLPGVWLGRGAARMTGVHGVVPGRRAVVVAATEESLDHLAVLHRAGVSIAAVVAPRRIAEQIPPGDRVIADGEIASAHGRGRVRRVVIRAGGRREVVACDTLVLSLGLIPRDGLLRQAGPEDVVGAGDVVQPGCSLDEAIQSGHDAAHGVRARSGPNALPVAAPVEGFVCLCEDVGACDLAAAWREGFQNTELLKRYTTTTMGPCQGLMCHAHLRAFVRERTPTVRWSAPTTARPPARPVTLEDASAGVPRSIEHRTTLHDRHVELGASMEWSGVWKRPQHYGDTQREYWAVRRGVSIMDVGTLGKYRVCGRDAGEFLDRIYPMHVRTLGVGRSRYGLLLNEAGYVFDDGLVCAVAPDDYYVTFTSAGGDNVEAWLRDWAETWRLRVHILNLTTACGAINLAGPRAREVLASLTADPIDAGALPHGHVRRITVAGVPCLAMRVGFVGELSFELHHPSSRSVTLWDALLAAGAGAGIQPHGLDALLLLRLEKGHIVVGQDTDFDSSPQKLGLSWAVKMEKPRFVGRTALARLATLPPDRTLVTMTFPGGEAPADGAQLLHERDDRHVGYLTSSRFSPVLGQGVALGWLSHVDGVLPSRAVALSAGGKRFTGTVSHGAAYDPDGTRLRA